MNSLPDSHFSCFNFEYQRYIWINTTVFFHWSPLSAAAAAVVIVVINVVVMVFVAVITVTDQCWFFCCCCSCVVAAAAAVLFMVRIVVFVGMYSFPFWSFWICRGMINRIYSDFVLCLIWFK